MYFFLFCFMDLFIYFFKQMSVCFCDRYSKFSFILFCNMIQGVQYIYSVLTLFNRMVLSTCVVYLFFDIIIKIIFFLSLYCFAWTNFFLICSLYIFWTISIWLFVCLFVCRQTREKEKKGNYRTKLLNVWSNNQKRIESKSIRRVLYVCYMLFAV